MTGRQFTTSITHDPFCTSGYHVSCPSRYLRHFTSIDCIPVETFLCSAHVRVQLRQARTLASVAYCLWHRSYCTVYYPLNYSCLFVRAWSEQDWCFSHHENLLSRVQPTVSEDDFKTKSAFSTWFATAWKLGWSFRLWYLVGCRRVGFLGHSCLYETTRGFTEVLGLE